MTIRRLCFIQKGILLLVTAAVSFFSFHPAADGRAAAQSSSPEQLLVRLTAKVWVSRLTWLTGTSLLAGVVSRATSLSHIAVVTLPRGEVRILANGECGSASPDRTRVAWIPASPGYSEQDVWVLDVRRATRRRLTTGQWAFCLAWSPDGRHIAITRQSLKGPGDEILIIAADSGRIVQTMAQHDLHLGGPTWTPDGRKVAVPVFRDVMVSMRPPKFTYPVNRIDLYDVWARRSTVYLNLSRTDAIVGNLAFRPNGRVLLYEVRGQIFAYDGRIATLVTSGRAPAWHPAGRSFVFARGNDCAPRSAACAGGYLYVMNY